MIKTLNAQINQLERQIATASPRAPRRPDLPLAVQIASERDHRRELFAEIGDCRERYPTRDALAAVAGQAAVASSPANARPPASAGGATSACAVAFCRLADSSRHWHPWAAGPLRPSPPTRPRTPKRDPHPRTRLVPCRVALLARPRPIRPGTTPRAATPHHRHHPDLVGPPARPRRHPADGRRRCHPTGGPQGRARQRLTASRHPLPTRRLTQDVFGDIRITPSPASDEHFATIWIVRAIRAARSPSSLSDAGMIAVSRPRYIGSAAILKVVALSLLLAISAIPVAWKDGLCGGPCCPTAVTVGLAPDVSDSSQSWPTTSRVRRDRSRRSAPADLVGC